MISLCIKLMLNLSVDRNIVSTGSSSVGAIVGGVFGAALPAVILLVLVIAVVVILACLRRKSKMMNEPLALQGQLNEIEMSAQQLPSDQMKFELESNKAYASITNYISIEENVAYFQTTPQIPTEGNVAYGQATLFRSQQVTMQQ